MATNYGSMLKSLQSEKGMGEKIMDAISTEMVKGFFDDSMSDSDKLIRSNKENEAKFRINAVDDKTKRIADSTKNADREIDNIIFSIEKRKDPKSKNSFTGLKEIKDGEYIYHEKGTKEAGLVNYGLLQSEQMDSLNKYVKNSDAFKLSTGQNTFLNYDNEEKTTFDQSLADAGKTGTNMLNSLVIEKMSRKEQFNQLASTKQVYNANLKGNETNYNPSVTKIITDTINNLESTYSINYGEAKNDETAIQTKQFTKRLESELAARKKIAPYDSDNNKPGIQLKKAIEKSNIPFIFDKNSESDNQFKERLSKISNGEVRQVFGQPSITLKQAANSVDKLMETGEYELANYVLNKMVPGKDPKASMKTMIEAQIKENIEGSIKRNNEMKSVAKDLTKSLLTTGSSFIQKTPTRGVPVEQGVFDFSPKEYQQSTIDGESDGKRLYIADENIAITASNITSYLSDFNTTISTPNNNSSFHSSSEGSTTKTGREIIKMGMIGTHGSDWMMKGSKVQIGVTKTADGDEPTYILIGAGELDAKTQDENKGLRYKDIDDLSSEEVESILLHSIPTPNGNMSYTQFKAGGKGDTKTSHSDLLDSYRFNPNQKMNGSESTSNEYTAFADKYNNTLYGVEGRFYSEALSVYHKRKQLEKTSRRQDEKIINLQNRYQEVDRDTVERTDFGTPDYKKYTKQMMTNLGKPGTTESSLTSLDNILEGISQVESNGDTTATNENTNGTKDYGEYQINENWFSTNTSFNKEDDTFKKTETLAKATYPNWDDMDNDQRGAAFLGDANKEFSKEFAKIILESRGANEWSTGKQGGRLAQYLSGSSNAGTKEQSSIKKNTGKKEKGKEEKGKESFFDSNKAEPVLRGFEPGVGVNENQLRRQASEVLNVIDKLENLQKSDPDNFDRATKLKKLTEMSFKDVDTYQDTSYKGDDISVPMDKSILAQNLSIASSLEQNQARKVYEMAKNHNMKLPFNMGDTADAGYDIYREFENGNEIYQTPAMEDAIGVLKDLMAETSQEIEPLKSFARKQGGNQEDRDFIDRGQGGGRDANTRGGTVFDFTTGAGGLKEEAYLEKNQPFLTGKQRLSVDIANLSKAIADGDSYLGQYKNNKGTGFANQGSKSGLNLQKELYALTRKKELEETQLANMTMSQTKDAALAVLKEMQEPNSNYSETRFASGNIE